MSKKPRVGKVRRYEEMACPNCGKVINASAPIGHDQAPWEMADDDEAITVCIQCARLLVWDKQTNKWALVPTEQTKAILDETPHLREVMASALGYIAARKT